MPASTPALSHPNRRHALSRLAGLATVMAVGSGLGACSTAAPKGVEVVKPFDVRRYAGLWYEIARLDHSFERGLSRVTANYSLRDDGSIQVVNRGFDSEKQKWKEAEGVAKFIGPSDTGSLKVSFFGPFYGGYHVIALDSNYQWSMVIGPDTSYLWILCRQQQLPPGVKEPLLNQARSLGVQTEALIWVDQRESS